MNRGNPKKLLQSKWTAVTPRNKEKHYLVVDVKFDAAGVAQTCILEAVHSRREIELDWRELKNTAQWLHGWR